MNFNKLKDIHLKRLGRVFYKIGLELSFSMTVYGLSEFKFRNGKEICFGNRVKQDTTRL